MSLVVCEKCGKKVSDTRNTCVHCGALLQNKIEKSNKQTESLINFDNLDSSKKIQMEQEFIEKNKGAYKYKQKTTFDKFATFTMIFNFLFLICYFAFMIYLSVAEPSWYDENNIDETIAFSSLGCVVFSFLIILLWKIVEAIKIIVNRNSIKKYVYIKEFQKWLLEKKNINYIPIFNRDSQKEIFDNIDLKYMKL